MYVATVPNRASAPAILLRESYRENGKVRNRTLANLSDWPAEKVEALRAVLRGDRLAAGWRGRLRNPPLAAAWPCRGRIRHRPA